MFSQTVEYALRAVVCLAGTEQRPWTTQQIAERTRVPAGYLSKVLQSLGRSGLVQSQRGLHGGFTLAQPASKVTVLDVIEAVDPIRRIEGCPLELENHGKELCPLHHRLDEAIAHIRGTFEKSTIAELVDGSNGSIPLCDEP